LSLSYAVFEDLAHSRDLLGSLDLQIQDPVVKWIIRERRGAGIEQPAEESVVEHNGFT